MQNNQNQFIQKKNEFLDEIEKLGLKYYLDINKDAITITVDLPQPVELYYISGTAQMNVNNLFFISECTKDKILYIQITPSGKHFMFKGTYFLNVKPNHAFIQFTLMRC